MEEIKSLILSTEDLALKGKLERALRTLEKEDKEYSLAYLAYYDEFENAEIDDFFEAYMGEFTKKEFVAEFLNIDEDIQHFIAIDYELTHKNLMHDYISCESSMDKSFYFLVS